ncbi:hypothetical protein MMC15_002351 [Xylographa vitiligo]|nr:hypothetical protein [Xylographa vitiligo]
MAAPEPGETWITHIFSVNEHNDQYELSIPFPSLGFVFDVVLLILPLGAVWNLQLPNQRKIGVTLIFMTGLLACIASLLSIYYRVIYNETVDTTWAVLDVDIMALVELYVGVIVSCMPSLSKLLQHHLSMYQSLRSKASARWSSLRTSRKSRASSRKNASSFGKPSAESYNNLEAYPVPYGPGSVEPQYELGQIKSVRTFIDAGNNEESVFKEPADDDRIHLTREIWQRG